MFPAEPDEQEAALSFDRLREVFAGLTDDEVESVSGFVRLDESRQDISRDVATEKETACETLSETDISITNGEERCELSPRTIFEAMLFVGDRENRPLSLEQAAKLMRNVSQEELLDLVGQLNHSYTEWGVPYRIIQEHDGYRMTLQAEFEPIRERFYGKVRETRLTQTAIDVLSIVAYQQPITADEVQKLRKSPGQSILSQLVKRGLLEIQKIIRDKRTVSLYRTTDRFLQLFQLESLDDLPVAEEIDYR
ncbi:MAG: SMC-Scp complex subunit ScpB [Planctomycetaceae bacterium]|nr:SMC-Scp complex subunit ScpB [Planctomycetaceae bacterium]